MALVDCKVVSSPTQLSLLALLSPSSDMGISSCLTQGLTADHALFVAGAAVLENSLITDSDASSTDASFVKSQILSHFSPIHSTLSSEQTQVRD